MGKDHDNKYRVPSRTAIWKGMRKDPTPPGRTIQPKDRRLRDEEDAHEMETPFLTDWLDDDDEDDL